MSSVGRRYAKAIYELAAQEKLEERVGKELSEAATMWATSPELRMVFENPRVPADVRKKTLADIATRSAFAPLTKNTLGLLGERGRLADLADISRSYQAFSEERGGSVKAEVISATALPEAYFLELARGLERATGKKVKIEKKVDPSIIGGIVAKVGDKIFDGSLRNRLDGLKDELLGQ
jgi:F-type H+-transporting ATPase subunit delta